MSALRKSAFHKEMTCKDHYATGETFDVYKCESCGFLFTQGIPVEAEIGRYYESPDYISHSDTHHGLMNRVYHWVRRYMLVSKARLIKHNSGLSRGRLLDIGTGTGYFPHFMKEKGWRVTAIEKSPQARTFAQTHFGLEVDAPEKLATYEDASFDVITLWHVMEHLEHLNETWETLSRILQDRGILVIAVPNPSSFDARNTERCGLHGMYTSLMAFHAFCHAAVRSKAWFVLLNATHAFDAFMYPC